VADSWNVGELQRIGYDLSNVKFAVNHFARIGSERRLSMGNEFRLPGFS
jgi:hypothetical protein